ncbi:MAG: hypothetical protein CMJ40_00740 [Phycisphaerae bacterium]|nr:hypothetical protein [Phycisphaerae bacterium]|tara:strand:- start:338 stop:613 length:276 start_codon:yes stop_codon:yes gene_type:complete
MSLNASAQQIYINSQKLITRWQKLKETWNDPVYKSINEKFIVQLDREVRNAIVASERMNQILEEAVEELATHDPAPYGMQRSRKSNIDSDD